jgi:hypothetical protein
VPVDLTLRLDSVVIEADGWRDKDVIWYEQLCMLFESANREGVLVLDLPEQYFPTHIEMVSDVTSYWHEDGEGYESSITAGVWTPWYSSRPNAQRIRDITTTEEVFNVTSSSSSFSSSASDNQDKGREQNYENEKDQEDYEEDKEDEGPWEGSSGSGIYDYGPGERSRGRRKVDRYMFKAVPDTAFHEGSDGDFDESDSEDYRFKPM